MKDKKTIQRYVNNFRRHLSPFLKPGIGLSSKIHPAIQEGAILEFSLGADVSNEDEYIEPAETVNSALRNVQQRMFGGNLDAIRFGGTNISMEPDRIVLIKGEDSLELWSDDGARTDVQRIVNVSSRRPQ
jgi:hypothetical protein